MPTDLLDQLSDALSARYAVDRLIGVGGMATVYLARDLRHDRLVALKVLNPELGAMLGVERFLAGRERSDRRQDCLLVKSSEGGGDRGSPSSRFHRLDAQPDAARAAGLGERRLAVRE